MGGPIRNILFGGGDEIPPEITSQEAVSLQKQLNELKQKFDGQTAEMNALRQSNASLNQMVSNNVTQVNNLKTANANLKKQVNDSFGKINGLENRIKTLEGNQLTASQRSDINAIVKVFASSPINAAKINNLSWLVQPGNFSQVKNVTDLLSTDVKRTNFINSKVTSSLVKDRGIGTFHTIGAFDSAFNPLQQDVLKLRDTTVPNLTGRVGVVEGRGQKWVQDFINTKFIKDKGFLSGLELRNKITKIGDTQTQLNNALTKIKSAKTKLIDKSYSKIISRGTHQTLPTQDPSSTVTVSGKGVLEYMVKLLAEAPRQRARGNPKTADDLRRTARNLAVGDWKNAFKELGDSISGSNNDGGIIKGSKNNRLDLANVKTV